MQQLARTSLATQAQVQGQAQAQEQAHAQAQAEGPKFFLFLVPAPMLAFELQQVKSKYRSSITQAQGYLPHMAMFGQ